MGHTFLELAGPGLKLSFCLTCTIMAEIDKLWIDPH